MQATLRRDARLPVPLGLDVVGKTIAALLAVATVIGAIVTVRHDPTTSVEGRAATVWMSGEARGRVVLSAARGERPSIAIELDSAPSSYDLADLGTVVLVHDRLDGSITELDGRDGLQRATSTGPIPTDERASLVAAGDSAYLVDPAAHTVQRLDADGSRGEVTTVENGFTDWVGTSDGTLWLVNSARGTYGSFDGEFVAETRLAEPGAALRLTAAGAEPAVFDPTTNRVRWLRRTTSVEVQGTGRPGTGVAIQEPDPAATCVGVATGDTLSCLSADGTSRSVTIAPLDDLDSAQLVMNESNAVLTWPGSEVVVILSWEDGSATTRQRGDPSPRRIVGSTSSGPIVVDDPGSRFAFSVDDGAFVALDKFSKRTVVISSDGSAAGGVGALDDEADIAGVFSGGDSQSAPPDDDGANDPPEANPDRITTRVGRSVTIGVLANDTDPDGDPLSVVEAGPLDPGDGVVTVLEGSRINYVAPATSVDRTITFAYGIADIGNLRAESTVTVEIIGSGRNTDPVLGDDSVTTQINAAVDIPVFANDSDDEGDPLTITAVTRPEHGSSAIGADGIIRFEPSPGYTGTDSFTYEVHDGYGGEAVAAVQVIVERPVDVNRPPIAIDDRSSTPSGQRVRVDVLANDSDPDGDSIRVVGVSAVPGIEVTVVDNRSVDVLPGPTVAGLIAFDYTVSDPDGLEATAQVVVFVQPVSAPLRPTAVDDFATSASIATSIDVVANDVDPSGSQLIVDQWTQPPVGRGTVIRLSPTTLQFTPVLGETGTVRFNYTVKNVAGLSATATVSVEVTPRSGSGPVARNDSVQIFPGEIATVAVLLNDTHPDGLPFDFAGAPVTRGGTASINADRAIVFTPPNDQLATYVITYTIQDAFQAQSRATLSVSVVGRPSTNQPPIAVNDLQTVQADTPVTIDVLANDNDPDGDSLQIIEVEQASSGRAELAANRIRYTPTTGFSGIATVGYTVSDPDGHEARATVTLLVADRVKLPPVAVADLATLVTGTSDTVNPVGNDIDPDGVSADLSLSSVGAASPAGGVSLVMVGQSVRITALTLPGTYTASYVVADADGQTDIGTITVVVQVPPNNPPIAVADAYISLSVATTLSVLDNDVDPDGGALTLVSVSAPVPAIAGTAAIVANQIVFTPIGNFSGSVGFSYTVRDAQNATDTTTVAITVSACPAVPVLNPISVITGFETAVAFGLFGDGGTAPAGTTTTITAPSAGTATLNAAGTAVTYVPAAGFNGIATMGYSVRTTCGNVANDFISITVNRAPIAVDDGTALNPINTGRGQPVIVPVLANDTDPDGDALHVVSVGLGVNGVPSLSAGVVTFTPATGFTGQAGFTYLIADVGGLTDTATVIVNVANAPPVAVPDTSTTARLLPIVVAVIANDTDPNGDELSLIGTPAIISPAAGAGSVTASGNSIAYTPGTYLGPVVISYMVSDGLDTDTGTLTVNVTNRPPIAVADVDFLDLALASSVVNPVLANDSDPDGSTADLTLSVTPIDPSVGTVTASGGSITFTRAATLTAPATVIIAYTITDLDGDSASGTLTITVTDSTAPPATAAPPAST